MRILLLAKTICLFGILLSSGALCQDFFDDFDDGALDGWTLLNGGNYEISSAQSHSPDYSMRAWEGSPSYFTIVQRDGFSEAEGVYEAWFFTTTSFADGNLYFQYTDADNYYQVNCAPLDSDQQGQLDLIKKVNGVSTFLAQVVPTFYRNEWFKTTVHRYADGPIEVYINGALQISVIDTDITGSAGLCVGSYDEAFVDDVKYAGFSYVTGDVNGSCSYNGLDITYGVSFLKGETDSLITRNDCLPY